MVEPGELPSPVKQYSMELLVLWGKAFHPPLWLLRHRAPRA